MREITFRHLGEIFLGKWVIFILEIPKKVGEKFIRKSLVENAHVSEC